MIIHMLFWLNNNNNNNNNDNDNNSYNNVYKSCFRMYPLNTLAVGSYKFEAVFNVIFNVIHVR